MAVEINGKVYRNLPEQVKKNQDDIEELQGSIEDLEAVVEDKAEDSEVVHNTGDESIAGVKTFSSNVVVEYSNKKIAIKNNGFTHTNNDSYASQNLVFADPSVAHTITIPAVNGTLATTGDIAALNIQNGTGTNAVQEKMADATVNFAGRNPNAEVLDPTISTTINTGASGSQSAAFGKNTMALATASFTNGNKTLAKGEESHAEGYQSVTLGDGAHAEGSQTVAAGLQSHSEGALTQALGAQSHAEGHDTIAAGLASHAEGAGTKIGSYSPAADQGADQSGGGGGGGGGDTPPSPGTFTAGEGSHAEGYNNIVSSFGAHAEGLRNYLTGNYAHIEGVNNTNSADYAHVEGYNNINSGQISHVEGTWNNNSGYNSFVTGHHNKNIHEHKAVFGRYNENKAYTLLEVGNGNNDNDRKNAFEVYSDGTIGIPNFATVGAVIPMGMKRIKCVNGVLTVID